MFEVRPFYGLIIVRRRSSDLLVELPEGEKRRYV